MSSQIQGAPIALTVRTSAPSLAGDGVLMAQFQRSTNNANRPKRFFVQVNVSNAGTSCQLTLYGRNAGAWGIPVDASGNFGVMGNGAALLANSTYFFIFEDMAGCSELVLVQHDNVGGTPVCTATMAPLYEGGC